jgi:histidyl-tRNA synthetase
VKAGEPTEPLRQIIQDLGARGLADYVRVDYGVIRGLAYYTGTVFEAFALKESLRAIAGGGRYDNLVKLISGGKVQMPALGFGMGDVVLLELIKARQLLPSFEGSIDVFCIIEEAAMRSASLRLISELREGGVAVDYSLGQVKPDKQFKRAQELKVAQAVKLEKTDSGQLQARIRDMRTREEQRLSVDEAKILLTRSRERKG